MSVALSRTSSSCAIRGATAIDLAGMSLTNDPAVKAKFVFPGGTVIPAWRFPAGLCGWRRRHAANRLSAQSRWRDLAALRHARGRPDPARFDHFRKSTRRIIPSDGSAPLWIPGRFARQPWARSTVGSPYLAPSPRCASTNGSATRTINSMTIFSSFTIPPRNRSRSVGMRVTDDFINFPALRTLPPLTFMAPSSFLRMDAVGADANPANSTELPFRIDASFGFLALIGQNGAMADLVDVVSQAADTSTGRNPNGGVAYARFGLAHRPRDARREQYRAAREHSRVDESTPDHGIALHSRTISSSLS